MRVLAVAVALTVGLLAAACSGDEDVAITTAPVITSDTLFVTTTTDSPTTTTVADPTTVPSSTVPDTTTLAPTTAEPPTTDPELEQVRQDVAAAIIESWEAFDAVVRDPGNTVLTERLEALSTEEEFRGLFERFVVRYISFDLAERTNEAVPSRIIPDPESLEVDLGAGTASMSYCLISTNRLIQIQDDGSEELQDDRVAVVLGTDSFVLIDGRWIDSGGETNEVLEGEVECPEP